MRYAAFLRAVNLGKNRRVTNDRLKELFEEAGAEEVATFRTSGNVVFEASRDMARDLEKHLEKALGHEMVIFLRTAKELDEIAAAEPFPAKDVKRSKGKLQVALFEKKPTAAVKKKVLALAHRRRPARVREARAVLAAERRLHGGGARPEGARRAARPDDPAHQGHGRPAPREVLRLA